MFVYTYVYIHIYITTYIYIYTYMCVVSGPSLRGSTAEPSAIQGALAPAASPKPRDGRLATAARRAAHPRDGCGRKAEHVGASRDR